MKRRTSALLNAILLLPFNVLVVIPSLLLWIEGDINPGWGRGAVPIMAGVALIVPGVVLAVHTMRLFHTYGKGTPAPWAPPGRLVVRGAYRYMRNPMLTGIICILFGESTVLGSDNILAWAALMFVANHVYFIFFEEPGLERRFGEEYLRYKREVPRWLPRRRPYENQ